MSKYILSICTMLLFACSLEELPEDTSHLTVEAKFSIDKNNCTVPCRINFTSESINAEYYDWDFGDGTTAASPTANHTYLQAGMYEVTHTARNILGAQSVSQTITILDGSTFHLANVNRLRRISDMELLEDGSLIVSGENQFIRINKQGEIKSKVIVDDPILIMEKMHSNDGILTVSNKNVDDCLTFNSLTTQLMDFSGGILSSLETDCNHTASTDIVAIGNDRFATIGKVNFIPIILCEFCPPDAGDLLIIDKEGTVTQTSLLDEGKITTAISINYYLDQIILGGGVLICLDENCDQQRYDFVITLYDENTLELNGSIRIDNTEKQFNLISDFIVDENGDFYFIGQASNDGRPFEECAGRVMKVDENSNIIWSEPVFSDQCILPLSIDIFKDEILITGIASSDGATKVVLTKLSKEKEFLFPNKFVLFDVIPQEQETLLAKGIFDSNGQIILLINSTEANIYRLNPDGTL